MAMCMQTPIYSKLLRNVALFLFSNAVITATWCDVNVKTFGAMGNGIDSDDDALRLAFEACSEGGRITFPEGQYLLSPFNMTSNLEIFLDEGSVLLATGDFDKWQVVAPLPSYPVSEL